MPLKKNIYIIFRRFLLVTCIAFTVILICCKNKPAEDVSEASAEPPEEAGERPTPKENSMGEEPPVHIDSNSGSIAFPVKKDEPLDLEAMTEIVTGKLAYDIERNMHIFENYLTTVTVSKSQEEDILYRGLNPNRFTATKINITSQAKIVLIDPSGGLNFKITPLNNTEQFVNISSNTIWKWNVMPIKKGSNLLILRATIKIFNETSNAYKDVTIFEEPISIKASFFKEAKVFIASNWQYLLSTLIIPIGLWLFKKRKTS